MERREQDKERKNKVKNSTGLDFSAGGYGKELKPLSTLHKWF